MRPFLHVSPYPWGFISDEGCKHMRDTSVITTRYYRAHHTACPQGCLNPGSYSRIFWHEGVTEWKK